MTWSSHAWTPWRPLAVAIWTGEDFGTDFGADVAALFAVLAALFGLMMATMGLESSEGRLPGLSQILSASWAFGQSD